MARKIAAVLGGVLLGLIILFARAGAFPFWGSDDKAAADSSAPPTTSSPMVASVPAAPNAPEPNERPGVIGSFAPLVKRVFPTVVSVRVVQDVKPSSMGMGPPGEGGDDPGDQGGGGGGGMPPQGGGGDPFEQFRRFFGGQMPKEYKQHGLGSGVIISPDGYILTNNHVVGDADEIKVTLYDKREFTAKVIGKDQKTDLALIKIDTKEQLPIATLGDSDKTEIGDWVVAIGNPFDVGMTVTAGIVSAKGRPLGGNYDDFIQTDASINPGNSGGPLFNTDGQVIGINTAIYSRTGANNGIGFAIPIDLARSVVDQLKAHGRVVRAWLGVEIQEVNADLAQSFGLDKPEGALVAAVDKDGPAAKAGIQRGDIVIKFNGRDVEDEHELPALVAQTPINKTVDVIVLRNGKQKTFQVTTGELKEQEVASAKTEEPGGDWGMKVGDITQDLAQQFHLSVDKGVVIRSVQPDSPAAEASLEPGDIILEVNHDKVANVKDFISKAKDAKGAKKPALLLVQRGSATLYTVIKPSEDAG
ncbi:MAG: DegQ family serine endoprotease [Candidatus Binataceae bacterium]